MREIRFVLFDFDGVIADTEISNADYLSRALQHYGVILSEAEKCGLPGVNDPLKVAQFLKRANPRVSLEEFQAYRKSLGNTYADGNLQAMPGLKDVLNRLHGMGVPLALVSSTSTCLIQVALRRLNLTGSFSVVIGGDMVKKRKPEPEPYQTAMKILNARPEECLVVEDSPVGIQAGKAAGAVVVGYCGSKLRQDVSEANYRMDSYRQFFSLPVCFRQ